MHECRGKATIKLEVVLPIRGQFNGNYRSGEEELEDQSVEALLSYLPTDLAVEIIDVQISDYELLEEAEDEDAGE
jgi:hypothetical protein